MKDPIAAQAVLWAAAILVSAWLAQNTELWLLMTVLATMATLRLKRDAARACPARDE